MLNALRLNAGFTTAEFEARTGLDASEMEPALAQLAEKGLLEQDNNGIRTTAQGRRFLDSVVMEFFPG